MRHARLALVLALACTACRTEAPAAQPAAKPAAQPAPQPAPQAAAKPAEPAHAVASVPAVPIVPAAEKPAAAPAQVAAAATQTRAQRMSAVVAEHGAAMNAYYELFREAKTEEESRKVAETAKPPDVAGYVARVQALIDEDPKDDTAMTALIWMLQNGRSDGNQDSVYVALETYHLEDPRLKEATLMLVYSRSPRARKLLEHALADSTNADVRGAACYALAQMDMQDIAMVRSIAGMKGDDDGAGMRQWLGEEEFARLSALDLAAAQASAVARLERVQREFGDVHGSRGTLGESAAGDLFELRNLAIGQVAPDIEGESVAGGPLKLSDYRGKVVVLDFWGNW